jgi:hypothetical protein
MAGRLLAACWLFVRADYAQWAEESAAAGVHPLRQLARINSAPIAQGGPAISPWPVVVSCSSRRKLQFPP